jgi:hypothetical protein
MIKEHRVKKRDAFMVFSLLKDNPDFSHSLRQVKERRGELYVTHPLLTAGKSGHDSTMSEHYDHPIVKSRTRR